MATIIKHHIFFRECPPRPVDVSPEEEARNKYADPSANPSVTSCPAPTHVSDNLPPPPSSVLKSPVPPTRTKRGGMSPLLKRKRVGILSGEKGGREDKEGGGEGGGRLGEATQVQQVNGGVSDPPQRR